MLVRLAADRGPWQSALRGVADRLRRSWNPGAALIWLVLLALVIGSTLVSPAFGDSRNVLNILRQSAVLACLAIGQHMVIMTGGIDLSGASLVKLSAMVGAAAMAGQDAMLLPAILLVMGIGLLVGIVNGLLVVRAGIPPFIATFAMFFLLRGAAFVFSTHPIGRASPMLFDFYSATLFGLPLVLYPLAVLWLSAWYSLNRTGYGRHVYGAGGDPKVAALAGVNVRRVRFSTYVISSLLAVVAAVYIVSRSGVGDPQTGEGLLLDSIAAVVLGGTSFFGGRGSIVGTLGGVMVLIVIGNMFSILQISQFYQQLLKGVILIVAVAALRVRR